MLIDSDILIDFTHGEAIAVDWLDRNENNSSLKISTVTEMELLVGSRNKTHMRELIELFGRFDIVHIDEQISVKARLLIEEYYLSHGLLIADALIAGTAIVFGEELATKNKRDFKFITGLNLVDYP
jgi:predicted nucleic acid-binding protein